MTDAAILRQAAERPDAPAVINNGRVVPYAAVARAMTQFTDALYALGLRAGQVAAVECRDQYLHLLLLLAAERLGVTTATLVAHELGAAAPTALIGLADLVIAEQAARIKGARRIHAVDRAWIATALSLPGGAAPLPVKAPGDRLRIQRTSGTTGVPKRLVLTRALHERRKESWALVDPLGPGPRQLLASPFTIAAMYTQASNALSSGGTVVFETRVGMAEALVLHDVDRVTLTPAQLRSLIDAWPAGLRRPPVLSVLTIGGRIAPGLRRRALDKAVARLRELYSGNEAGNIAIVEYGPDPEAATAQQARAALFPGVHVEIRDEGDRPVPAGKPGRIRLRSPVMIDSYLDDPETTARMFRDGWFYPGDLGVLRRGRKGAPDTVEVLGRDDELLNIGGLKTLPDEIEDLVRARAPVADAGVCVLPNEEGIEELWIGVVYDAPDDRGLAERLRPALTDFPYGKPRLVKLGAIPRTATGKIRRAELRRLVAAASPAVTPQ